MVLIYELLKVGCKFKVGIIGASIMEDEEGEYSKILSSLLMRQAL